MPQVVSSALPFLTALFVLASSLAAGTTVIAETRYEPRDFAAHSIAPEGCAAEFERIGALDKQLDSASFWEANSSDIDRNFNWADLRRILIEAERGNPECVRPLSVEYAVRSMYRHSPHDRLLVKFLASENLLQPISTSQREALGGLWISRGENGYKIIGAYDCVKAVIYFDPSLSPNDLAGALRHELDHLVRDKSTWSGRPDLDPIIDEMLAILHSGFLQLESDYALHGDGLSPVDRNTRPKTILYRHGGNLEQIYREYAKAQRSSPSDRFFAFTTWLSKGFPGSSDPEKLRSHLLKIVETLSEAYFPGAGLNLGLLLTEFRNLSEWRLGKFPFWFVGHIPQGARTYRSVLAAEIKDDAINQRNLRDLRRTIAHLSASCQTRSVPRRGGLRQSYIGAGLKAPDDSGTGGSILPGNEGSKPASSSIHPCLRMNEI